MRRTWPFGPLSAPRVAGLTVVMAVAWSAPLQRLTWDTKYDLLIDPWGFLARSLHLWDPQTTWGGLANQGYGYLFPMGPFFGLFSEVLPMWVVQRLWWMALLSAGFIGAAGLLRALGIGSETVRIVAALSWVLAPKVLGSVAVLSAEIQPQILAPLILWPVVSGWRGRMGPGRAGLLSGLAVLGCGGVNASAVLLAILPTGLFLITRARWWRQRLTWYWLGAVVAATAWWVGPLVLMARFASPFLSWIETSADVSASIGMLDVVRGTTHWLGYLLTPGGEWWPGAYQLATSPWLIVLTTIVAAAGVCGLGHRDAPVRGFLWLSLGVGLVAMSLPHAGPGASPLDDVARAALDGPLSPFRNIHKADVLVRLPVMIGLAHFLAVVAGAAAGRRARWLGKVPGITVGLAAVLVVAAGAPGFTGAAVHRGGHEAVPLHWVQLGAWLEDNAADRVTLLVPAASFGEYRWGRSIDEPLRSLTSAQFAVRDAIPLTPAGTIRLLDAVEARLQTGRSLKGAAHVLRASGVRFIVVRNDLATAESGQPPVSLARSSVSATPGVEFIRGFGARFEDVAGNAIHPVEVYRIGGSVAAPVEIWDVDDLVAANGAADDLLTLADSGLGGRPVLFDGDHSTRVEPGISALSDGLRARTRFFGGIRGQDATTTLTRSDTAGARDYLPWSSPTLLSYAVHRGIADVSASSSLAEDQTFAGLQPSMRPFSAVDGNLDTGWLTMWDRQPTLRLDLAEPREVDTVRITPYVDRGGLNAPVSTATRVFITTDAGAVAAPLEAGPTTVAVPAGETSSITIEITDTSGGEPASAITGLAEVSVPGVAAVELLQTPPRVASTPPEVIALGAGVPGRDGCFLDDVGLRCLARQTVAPEALGGVGYLLTESGPGQWLMSGSLSPASVDDGSTGSAGIEASASSTRSPAPAVQAWRVLDGDHRTAWSPAFEDRTPALGFAFHVPTLVAEIRLGTRGDWARTVRPLIRVEIGGQEFTRRLSESGVISIPATRGEGLRLTFLPVDREAPMGSLELEEVTFPGVRLQPPMTEVAAPCGSGPVVTVNGATISTSATVSRDGRLGLAPAVWQACEPVTLTGTEDVVAVAPWSGFVPSITTLTREGHAPSQPDPEIGTIRSHGQRLVGQIHPAAHQRLVVLTQNANPGWRATLDGEAMASQVVDGRRQGFVIPPGGGGALEVSFGPDRWYRGLLLVGAAAALLLTSTALIATVMSRRGRLTTEPAVAGAGQAFPQVVNWGVALSAGMVLAGPVGLVAAATGVGVASLLRQAGRMAASGMLTVAAGLSQAFVAPGSLGPPWLELGVRVALLLALAVAWAPGQSGRKPRSREFEELVAEEG